MRTVTGISTEAVKVALAVAPLKLRRKQITYNYLLKAAKVPPQPANPAFNENMKQWGGSGSRL